MSSEFLLQLEKQHLQKLENLKKQHTQLGEQIKSAQTQQAAVEGAFAATQNSLEEIQSMIKACNAAQAGQVESVEVAPPPPPAVEGEVVLPDYEKPVKPKKNAPRSAVVSTEAALPH